MQWLTNVLAFAKGYPEVEAICFGILLSGLVVALLDAVYFPEAWTLRQCQQLGVGVNLLLATGMSYGMWRFLDPADKRWFSLWVSASAAAASPMALYLGSKVLSWKFPSLNLSFGLLKNRKP